MTMQQKLLLFDADFLLYYATMGNKVLDEQGNPVKENNRFVYTDKTQQEVFDAADDIINNILNNSNANLYAGYIGNSKSFRYDVYPEYKGNRKDSVKPHHFAELKKYLEEKWNFILLYNRLEADDAVNIIRKRLQDTYDVYIVTNDKDLVKCIEGKYISPKDCEVTITTKEEAELGFWTSMIVGDATDNIKGIPKRGAAYAKKALTDIPSGLDYSDVVYRKYILELGFGDGYTEFNKNKTLLKILDKEETLLTPKLNEVLIKAARKEEISGESVGEGNESATSLW